MDRSPELTEEDLLPKGGRVCVSTVNVYIFTLNIFSRISRENMYKVKIYPVYSYYYHFPKTVNLNTRENVLLSKFTKIYTRENISVYSI